MNSARVSDKGKDIFKLRTQEIYQNLNSIVKSNKKLKVDLKKKIDPVAPCPG